MRSSSLSSGLATLHVNNTGECGSLTIGKRGVLLSVLGNDLVGTEVTADLDDLIKKRLTNNSAFFEFKLEEADKSQLCVSYNDTNNTVYIIGITDVIVGFAAAEKVDKNKVTTYGVKLKQAKDSTLVSNHLILARLEGRTGSTKKIAFYLISENSQ